MRLDLVHLARSLRRSPTSAAAAVVTLALTIGAGTSIFAVVDAVLLTPPPFADPDALVFLGETPLGDESAAPRAVPYATFEMWRARAGSLASLEASDGTNLTLTGLNAAERLNAVDTTPGFLRLLGVSPAIGRLFEPDDVAQPLVILNHDFWRGRFASDPSVIGRQLVLGGVVHTVVGVLPEGFGVGRDRTDLWRPLPLTTIDAARSGYRVGAMARLAPSASASQLASALDDVSRRSVPPARVAATPATTAIAGDSSRTLGVLAAGAIVAMLISFANLTGLLVVRSVDRRREMAVRAALGASRAEIAKQLLIEAAALVALGTLAGVLLAVWIRPMVARLAFEQFGAIANREMAISWRAIGIVTSLALVCGVLFGSLPVLHTVRRNVVDALRRGVTASPGDRGLRRLFVGGEVALAFVLLVSMALLGRTLVYLLNVSPGFDPRGVLRMSLSLPRANYPTPARVASFYSTLHGALRDRLGTRAIAVVDELPLTHNRGRLLVSARADDAGREAVVRTASPGYFDVMRIPIASGRGFETHDDAAAPRRVVVSESLARRLFRSEPAVGRQVQLGANRETADIVGVVGDVTHRALGDPAMPTLYVSGLQVPSPGSILVVRSSLPEPDVVTTVREEVARLDATLPVYGVLPMEEVAARSAGMPARRLLMAVFSGFALVALVLSAIGLFGVAAHEVASRRPELALRLALGADPLRLLRTTLRQGAALVGAGLAVGGVLSIWAARALSGVLVTTAGFDGISVGVAAALLLLTGVAAAIPAALRAARTDPLLALRSE